MNKQHISIIGAVLILLGLWAVFHARTVEAPTSETETATTTPIAIDLNATSTTQNGYTIERVIDTPVQPSYPSLNRPLSPQATPAQIKAVSTALDALKKNPNLFEQWMQLGLLRFILKDYEGAAQVWEYAGKNNVPGAYENLGNLYANNIKDPAKAELNYKKALSSDPTNPGYYRVLAEFYQSIGKNTEAEATLRAGIKAVPKAFDLSVLLARHLRATGNILESNNIYDAAATSAEQAGQTALAQSIRDERNQH